MSRTLAYFSEDYVYELEIRMKNLMWTISGDYSLDVKPDISTFEKMPDTAILDGIRQGALAKYFDRDALAMYLVKKIYCHADQTSLLELAQLCIEEAVGRRLDAEREGIRSLRRAAYNEILDREFHKLTGFPLGRFKIALMREELFSRNAESRQMTGWLEQIHTLREAADTMEIIRMIDSLYSQIVDPDFEKNNNTFEEVMAITLEDLTEFTWKDFLGEEAQQSLEVYLDEITESMATLHMPEEPEDRNEQDLSKVRNSVVVVDPKALARMYSYVEHSFGKSYMSETEAKNRNHLMCRGEHARCSLFYTEGILKNPVLINAQYELARKNLQKTIETYKCSRQVIRTNVRILTEALRKALVLRDEEQSVIADHGNIVPSMLWRVGRSSDARMFRLTRQNRTIDFVVDVLIDASGSQRKRQYEVAMQSYIISEALSNLEIPFRVMSFCTFWDYTVLRRFRDYGDDREANRNIFEFTTHSNNRDGLAIRAVGADLLQREEATKVMIILSDGKPNDVLVQRSDTRGPAPYTGQAAIRDTGTEVRKLRQSGVAVLGVFVGDETELDAERKIFGKDFAYIRSINNFAKIVGKYLLRQIEE